MGGGWTTKTRYANLITIRAPIYCIVWTHAHFTFNRNTDKYTPLCDTPPDLQTLTVDTRTCDM